MFKIKFSPKQILKNPNFSMLNASKLSNNNWKPGLASLDGSIKSYFIGRGFHSAGRVNWQLLYLKTIRCNNCQLLKSYCSDHSLSAKGTRSLNKLVLWHHWNYYITETDVEGQLLYYSTMQQSKQLATWWRHSALKSPSLEESCTMRRTNLPAKKWIKPPVLEG